MVFFLAGFDTSSTALTFSLLELARRPQLQSVARDHVEKVLKEHDGKITYDALQQMNYLDCILKGIVNFINKWNKI
jgi:cytochrome P450 family 6